MNLAQTVCAALLAGLFGAASTRPAEPQRSVFAVAMPAGAAWQDLAFLAAIPAACAVNGAEPLVLALGADGALEPETRDFLARYHPGRLVWIGAGADAPALEGIAQERIACDSADAAACALARACFSTSAKAVVAREDDYTGTLAASVLAARLRAPLLYSGANGLSEAARAVIEQAGASTLLLVGAFDQPPNGVGKATCERLRDPAEVARWMQEHRLPVGYLAAVAPSDRVLGKVRKLSLAGAVLAAGRAGALVAAGDDASAPAAPANVRAVLAHCRERLGSTPEFLCLAARPEALPMEVVPSGEGIDSDPPSDLSYANTDADPFLELAFGRFVAEDAPAATLLAARSLAYEQLLAPESAGRFGMAEWERMSAPLLENAGFRPVPLHAGGQPITQDSPLAAVGVLIHNAHSSWMQLGQTYMQDSRVLLAPCLVESAGCSPAALDQDPQLHSVALRLLRNGAIGFVGNVRRAIAQQETYRSEFWNAVLAGKALGRAHRDALNRQLVSMLANGESEHGPHRYEFYNEAFYGDPALALHLPTAPALAPARAELKGSEIVVYGPAKWWRAEECIVSDWNYDETPVIYSWRGSGVGTESSWDGAHKRNLDLPVFTAEVRTRKHVAGLQLRKPPPAPLGWDGKFFVDEHADGTRSIFFRVRFLDADMGSGKILQQLESLRLRVE
ncbi:MAG: hypothetical protein IPJ19_18640 [Planctomycetes bacterium]|nr:hypothetical protein [Planctomycetota bacterium]